jgi:RNA polymerase sigma factor (sigma-70 family)
MLLAGLVIGCVPRRTARRTESSRSVSDSLLKQVAAGNMAAMQKCIDEYGGLVWSLARRFCRLAADAEDAVQEVFIALWENAHRFDESKGAEVTFVSTIARRRLIDRLRRDQRRQRLQEEVQELAEPVMKSGDESVAISDEAARASAALARLSADQQRVLKLAIHYGLTHEQIASSTGLPLGTVKTHARRGLIRMRELLQTSEVGQSSGSSAP